MPQTPISHQYRINFIFSQFRENLSSVPDHTREQIVSKSSMFSHLAYIYLSDFDSVKFTGVEWSEASYLTHIVRLCSSASFLLSSSCLIIQEGGYNCYNMILSLDLSLTGTARHFS